MEKITVLAIVAVVLLGISGCARWTDASIDFTDDLKPRYQAEMNRETQIVNSVSLTVDTGSGPQPVPADQITSTGDQFRTYRHESPQSVPGGTQVSATWTAQFSGGSDTITRTATATASFDVSVTDVQILGVGNTQVTQTPGTLVGPQVNTLDYSWIGYQPVRVRVTLQNLGPNPTPSGTSVLVQWPANLLLPNIVLLTNAPIPPGGQRIIQTADGITMQVGGGGAVVATYQAAPGDTNPANNYLETSILVTQ